MVHLVVPQNKSAELVVSLARKRNRDHFKDVRANCFCASLLRTQIHMPRHATSCIERAQLSTKMNNDRADGHC